MIHKLLTYLNVIEIDYALISGYKKLFEQELAKGDIDILIRKNDFLVIEHILHDFCEMEGFKVVQNYHQEVLAKNIFIFDPKTQDLLNLDIYGELHRRGTQFYTEDALFDERKEYSRVSILNTQHEFIHYFIKKIDKNQLTENTFRYLYSLFQKNAPDCIAAIHQCFTKNQYAIVVAFQKNQLKLVSDLVPTLQKSIYSNRKITFRNTFLNIKRICNRIFRPTGIAICFLGPDGSGKSTIIDTLKERVLPFRRTAYYHLKPVKSKNESTRVNVNPHAALTYSKPKSFLKLLFFVYQYNKGWFEQIFFKKIKSTLVIFDRYYDDLKIDHKRFRYGGSKKWIGQFEKLIPKPTIYFVLTSSPEVIYSRKQEVPFEILERQITLYNGLQHPTYHHIEVNRPVQEIVRDVYNILMITLYERY